MSIKLYCFGKDVDSPSLSGFCEKVEAFLRASSFTDYTLHTTTPGSAPKGKLPYIEYVKDGKTETVADSHLIVRYLIENKVVPDMDGSLNVAQRAESRAWQAWTEELLYGIVVHERFNRPENYAITKTAMPFPWWIRPLIGWYMRRSILSSLWTSGIGRHSDEERNRMAREYFEGLEARLEGVEYFHGSKPTTIDTTLFGIIANTVGRPGNPDTTAFVLGSKRLRRYIAVMTRKWFPEYEALLTQVDESVD